MVYVRILVHMATVRHVYTDTYVPQCMSSSDPSAQSTAESHSRNAGMHTPLLHAHWYSLHGRLGSEGRRSQFFKHMMRYQSVHYNGLEMDHYVLCVVSQTYVPIHCMSIHVISSVVLPVDLKQGLLYAQNSHNGTPMTVGLTTKTVILITAITALSKPVTLPVQWDTRPVIMTSKFTGLALSCSWRGTWMEEIHFN